VNLNDLAARVADQTDEPVGTVKKVLRALFVLLANQAPGEVAVILKRYERRAVDRDDA